MTALLVALGAAVGAPLRYLIDRFVQERHDSVVPWGTFTVNLIASLLLGTIVGATASSSTAALLGTGFCGTLSTYSTFSFETMRLTSTGKPAWASLNVGLSLILGFAVAAAGWAIGAHLF
jgi:CrcB protein